MISALPEVKKRLIKKRYMTQLMLFRGKRNRILCSHKLLALLITFFRS
ncbi:hypothetical protein MXB_2845 [Myxobolus squamalis]|nr:hypothetical protein MXB_2845 [Myxobolus squamalis]